MQFNAFVCQFIQYFIDYSPDTLKVFPYFYVNKDYWMYNKKYRLYQFLAVYKISPAVSEWKHSCSDYRELCYSVACHVHVSSVQFHDNL